MPRLAAPCARMAPLNFVICLLCEIRSRLLRSPQLEEHPPHHFALVDSAPTVRVQFPHGRLGLPRPLAVNPSDFNASINPLVLRHRAAGPSRLLRLLTPFAVKQHGISVVADAGPPDFKTLLLQVCVENRTLAGLMVGWVAETLRPVSGHRNETSTAPPPRPSGDGNNYFSGLFLDGHRTVSGLFVNAKRTIEGRKLDSCRLVAGLFQDCFRTQRGPKQDERWAVSAPNSDEHGPLEALPGMRWRSRVQGGPGTGSFFRNDPSSADSR